MPGQSSYTFPTWDNLPHVPGAPQGCIWGFYDHEGTKDEIGAINLLTPEVVLAASREVQTGRSVQLDWPLHNLQFPGFGRKQFEHKLIDNTVSLGDCGFDDEIHLNTQSGSQWDSLKHYACQKERVFYNGLTYDDAKISATNGIHNWCERGGIVGRGLLIDMVRFYESRDGCAPDAWTRHEITLPDLKTAIDQQGSRPQQGDLLMIRSGYVRRHNQASSEERIRGRKENSSAIGLQASEEVVKWLYEQHFAAHVGDTVAFEAWPPAPSSTWVLHEWSLVYWGCPIGEMWDLEKLAAECEQHQRWTFMVTSAPLHVRGGVGSPPCSIAIF